MSHPHQFLLKELQIEINNLTPTAPQEIKEEAQDILNNLKQNEEVGEQEIHEAMVEIGKKSYPHRHAFEDMKEEVEAESLTDIALDQIDDKLREKIKQKINEDQTIHALIEKPEFEDEFNAQENIKIEKAIIDAKSEQKQRLAEKIKQQESKYTELVEKYQNQRKKIEDVINQIEQLAKESEKWAQEIKDEVANYREGWSVVENDPQIEEVEKKLEYWQAKVRD